jgi:triphosphoribosyl-dephospho-CoA synthase
VSHGAERAFIAACKAELDALKPGNVHRFADGHRMTAADFEASAEAAAPALTRRGTSAGQRVLAAVEATRRAVGQNTNLGIVLLCAPLAAAAERYPLEAKTVRAILEGLTVADAEQVFAAIRLAAPAGLGRSERHDVAEVPTVTLYEAMRVAADRDRIAWNYVNGLDDVLGFGQERLHALALAGLQPTWRTTGLYLGFLARNPDSHVVRKHGQGAAMALQRRAVALQRRFAGTIPTALLRDELLAWDAELKSDRINPGTSADLTVATLFARYLVADPGEA